MHYHHKPKIRLSDLGNYKSVNDLIHNQQLHTICESGLCPNKRECWARGTATFMILGNVCTRSCRFCGVATGRPLPADEKEPHRVAESVARMKLRHAVITSVDRDDLPDGGAAMWVQTIRAIRAAVPGITLETLIPDFKEQLHLLDMIIAEAPEVVSHNIETVARLSKQIRPQAGYARSLRVLRYLSEKKIRTKSGLMLGLGETNEEVKETLTDLYNSGCRIVTIGQYYQPSTAHHPVERYASPEDFAAIKQHAEQIGFEMVEASALVRSSYFAERHI